MPWVCASCGGANPDGTRFCGHCGVAQAAAAAGPATLTAEDVRSGVAGVAGLVSADVSRRRGGNGAGGLVNRPLTERLAASRVGVEERRLITALFADVSGFTALAHGLEAEQLVGIIGPIVSRLAQIVERYEGFVGKFAGDAILAFFGAPVSHEDDAARALLAAGDMQREMAEVLAGLGPEARHLTLHIGVNTGYVVAGHFGGEVQMEYSVLGDAVNVAQRLEAAAPGGAVYVGEETHRLTRDRFTFDDLGALTVKGKPDPIQAWRLRSEIPAAYRSGAGAGTPVRIVGRARELEALDRVLGSLAWGSGGVAGIVGEPGVGKSGLLAQARQQGAAAGARWVETGCLAHRARPYQPYVELVRVLTGTAEDAEPDAAACRVQGYAARIGLPGVAPFLLRLLGLPLPPELSGATPADPMAFQYGLVAALLDVLAAEAAVRPLVLCVEDLQWADDASTDLTRLVAGRAPAWPFGLVVTTRPEGRPAVEGVVGAAATSIILELGALDRHAVREMAGDILGGPPSIPLVDALVTRASGNPLFTQQLVRSLLDREALEPGTQGWRLRAGWSADAVPAAVEQVLAARIDQLPRPAADTLQTASVIGRDFPPALLERVTAGMGVEAGQAVDLLIAGGFLVPAAHAQETRLAFHHALLVDVAYGRLLKARRRQIHRQVFRALLELYGAGDDVVDALARHAFGGEMAAEALVHLSRAAARAAAMFANEQADSYLRQALELVEAAPGSGLQRSELQMRRARLEEIRGAYREALSLYDEVLRSTGDVRAAAGKASTLRKLGEYSSCLETIRAARAGPARLGPEETGRLALEEGWVLGVAGDPRRAVVVLRAGLEAVAGRDRRLEAELLIMLARTEELLQAHGTALQHAQAGLNRLDEREDLPLLATALRVLGGVQHDAGGGDPGAAALARATLERALAVARRIGNAEEEGAALVNLGRVLCDLGLVDDAIRCDREAAAAFEAIGLKAGIACAYCNLADHLETAGRWSEMQQAAERGLAVAREIGHAYWITGGLLGLASAHLAQGSPGEACAAADESAEVALAHGQRQRAVSALRTGARARERLGDHAAAAALIARADQLEGLDAR